MEVKETQCYDGDVEPVVLYLYYGKAPPKKIGETGHCNALSLFPSIRSVISSENLCALGTAFVCFATHGRRAGAAKRGLRQSHATRLGACSGVCSEWCLVVVSRVLISVCCLWSFGVSCAIHLTRWAKMTDGRSDDATVPATVSARLMQLGCGWTARYVHKHASKQHSGASALAGTESCPSAGH